MGLTRAAIARPLLTAMCTAALIALGIVGWRRMPVDLNPQANLPNVIVTTVYPGAGPSTVEQLLAEPLEDAIRGVANVKHVFTVSQESFCYLYADFEDGTDMAQAVVDCREAVDSIRGELPAEAEESAFQRLDINAQPVIFLGLVGNRPLAELRRIAEERLKSRLESVAGVAEVSILGGREPVVEVAVDRERLVAHGMTLSQLLDPLRAAGRDVPGGRLANGEREPAVRLLGEFKTLDDLRNVPLPPQLDPAAMLFNRPAARAPGRTARLGDVAEVRAIDALPDVRIRLQQREAVGLIVTKQGRSNTVEVSAGVRAAAFSAGLPEDIEILVARDTAATVREALSDVNASIAVGIILCALTIYLFLRSWRATGIVAMSIPVCLIGTFAFMAWGGNTLNQMTLLGLALSVGILVDDSIVCLEAITYRLHRGEPAAQAAIEGRNDIALADTSTTLIDLAVFMPIALMGGVVGQFFRDFGFVVAIAAALSLAAAYAVVPTLAAMVYRERPPLAVSGRRERAYRRLEERYRHVLVWALNHRRKTLALGWGSLLLAGLLAYKFVGVDFIPAADLSTLVVNVELPAGSSPAVTEAKVAEAEGLLREVPEVETLFTTLGKVETGFGIVDRFGPEYAQINVTLTDQRGMIDVLLLRGWNLRRRTDSQVADEVRHALQAVGGARWQVIAVHGWGGAGAPIDFSLYGDDTVAMAAIGEQIRDRLDASPLVLDADMSWRLGQPELQVAIDRDRARDALAYSAAVGRELRLAIAGDDSLRMRYHDEMVPLRLRFQKLDRGDADDVRRIPIGQQGAARMLTIDDVADVVEGRGPTRIDRRDGLRDLNFKAYLPAGVSLGEARQAIEGILADLGLTREDDPLAGSDELLWGWRGDAATLAASAGHMITAAVIGLILIYAIMAGLFNSAVHPLTIMLSVPMAIAGALLLLVITRSALSIVSGIGMILLLGIVVRNAILLIDHTLTLRAEGLPRREAVLESGVRRLRPILMTTLTTIFGMLPVAMKLGKGAEIRAPMAIAVIGGLTLSTLLTLVIIPVTYTIFDEWANGRHEAGAG